jgi:hypothetical protein
VHCRKEFTVPAASQAGGMPPAAAPAESKHTLLVVIAVVVGGIILVAILGAGFFIPALLKAQEFARRAACMKNIQQIGLAMRNYAGEYDDAFMPLVDENGNTVPTGREILPTLPARTGFVVLLKDGYLTTTKVFICPSSKQRINDNFPRDFQCLREVDDCRAQAMEAIHERDGVAPRAAA